MNKFLLTFYPLILFFVVAWQKTRPFRYLFSFSGCRFYPSCSDYFLESVKKRGPILGIGLGVKRLVKCNPFCEGGIDEVSS